MFDFLKRKQPPHVVFTAELLRMSVPQLKSALLNTAPVFMRDDSYRSVSEAEALDIMAEAWSEYIPNVNDCDKRAWRAKDVAHRRAARALAVRPWAFGYVHTADHAFNLFVDETRHVRLIDFDSAGGGRIVAPGELTSKINLVIF